MKTLRILPLLIATTSLAACAAEVSNPGPDPRPGQQPPAAPVAEQRSALVRDTSPKVSEADVAEFAKNNAAFAIDLMQRTAEADKNFVFSPHSISLALAMTYAGASGSTAAQMKQVLRFNQSDDVLHAAANALDLSLEQRGKAAKGKDGQPFRLRVNNALFAQKDYAFEAPFLDALALNYGTGVKLVDYKTNIPGAVQDINGWVDAKTESKIKNLVREGDFDRMSRLTLVNTVYMNAAWQTPFEKSATIDAPFAAAGGSVSVPTMRDTTYAQFAENADGFAVQLPFDDGDTEMVFISPNNLQSFESSLTPDKLNAYVQGAATRVDLSLPRFKLEPDAVRVGNSLKAMGMADAFSDSADFFKISKVGQTDPNERLRIQNVVHKAMIDVGEQGVEAAAATAVVLGGATSVPPPPKVVKFDRPFVFGIRDQKSGAWLFLGHVVNPLKKD
jgi:serpin B